MYVYKMQDATFETRENLIFFCLETDRDCVISWILKQWEMMATKVENANMKYYSGGRKQGEVAMISTIFFRCIII